MTCVQRYVEGQMPSLQAQHAGRLVLVNGFLEGTMKLPHRRQFLHLAAFETPLWRSRPREITQYFGMMTPIGWYEPAHDFSRP